MDFLTGPQKFIIWRFDCIPSVQNQDDGTKSGDASINQQPSSIEQWQRRLRNHSSFNKKSFAKEGSSRLITSRLGSNLQANPM